MKEFYTSVKVLGNNICYRGIDEYGRQIKYKYEYSPKLYVPSKKKSIHKNIYDQYVEEIEPGSIRETREFIKKYKDVDNFEILGDIGFDIQAISDKFKDVIEWDITKISIHILDIETASENVNAVQHKLTAPEEILLITIADLNTRELTTFTSREYTGLNQNNANIILCKDEYSLLHNFIDHWNRVCVDIISGFNSNGFDIPYLINRISRVMGDDHVKRLSPWNLVQSRKSKDKFGNEDTKYEIAGVSCLDFLELFLKFTYKKMEQNSLDYISQEILGVGKLDHSEFKNFKDFYTNGWNKFLDYNIVDVLRVIELDNKLNLISLALLMSYFAKINIEDVYSPIKTWDSIIYNHLKSKNIIIPKSRSGTKSEQFEGAYVKEPIPGMYEWVVSEDATGLYPSIMQTLNISPETFVGMSENVTVSGLMRKEYVLSDEYSTAANGAMFSKDKKGFLPELLDICILMRKEAKTKMLHFESELEQLKLNETYDKIEYNKLQNRISKYNVEQQGFKILNNSLYGAIGNDFCRYFELQMARAITLTGQYVIKTVSDGINRDLNEMFSMNNFNWSFYSDTDSCYITLKPIVHKFYSHLSDDEIVNILDKIIKNKITPIINKYCSDIQEYLNAYRNMLSFKQESISKNSVFCSKKHYFMNVLDNEGVRYTTPKLKIMGLDAVKSSTPKLIRDKMKECLGLILDGDELVLQKCMQEFNDKFRTYPIEDISFPRGVNNIAKYMNSSTIYSLGCPINSKSAILYNKRLKELRLENTYSIIGEGDKIKFIYLKKPNPIRDIVIGFPNVLPKEFNLHEYIDYDTQYKKSFLDPMVSVLNIVGWKTEKTNSIDDFFS